MKGDTGTSMGGTIEYTRMKKKNKEPENKERKKGACLNCAYYYQQQCTFDGSLDPSKYYCENFASSYLKPKENKGIAIWKAKQQKKKSRKKSK